MLLVIRLHLRIGGLNFLGQLVRRNDHVSQIKICILALILLLHLVFGNPHAGRHESLEFLARDIFRHAALKGAHVADSLLILAHVQLAGRIRKQKLSGRVAEHLRDFIFDLGFGCAEAQPLGLLYSHFL